MASADEIPTDEEKGDCSNPEPETAPLPGPTVRQPVQRKAASAISHVSAVCVRRLRYSMHAYAKVVRTDLHEKCTALDAKYEALLRRLCEKKKKKPLRVPESIHKLWLEGGKTRRDLRKVLIEVQGNEASSGMFGSFCKLSL